MLLCPACLFVVARELLPAFGPIAASSSLNCHRLTRMSTNKDAFLKLQGEAQKADQESLRRPRLTDFGSPHRVKATSTFQPTFSLAAPDHFQVGLSFCRGYGPCPACSLGLSPPHCRRRLTLASSGLPRGVKGVGFLQWSAQQVSGFLYCIRVVWSALRSDWDAIVEVFYPDGSWNVPTSICLVNAWSSTRTQASRQVTATTCATQRPQPTNPRTRDSPHTAPPHSLTRPQARNR